MALSKEEEQELQRLRDEDELERLKAEQASEVAANQPPGTMATVARAAMTPIPGLSDVAQAVRTDIPGAIATKTGEIGEGVGGLPGAAIKAAGVGTGLAMGMAGEMIPATPLEVGLDLTGAKLGAAAWKGAAAHLFPPLEKRAPNIVRAVRAAVSADILPTIAQMTQSKPMAAVEEVISRIPFIGRRVELMREEGERAFNEFRSKFLAKAGPEGSPAELGARTQARTQMELNRIRDARERELANLHRSVLESQGPKEELAVIGQHLDEIRMARVNDAKATAEKLYRDVVDEIPAGKDAVHDGNIRAAAADLLAKYDKAPLSAKPPYSEKTLKRLRDIVDGPGENIIENAPDIMMKQDPQLFGAQAQIAKAMKERKTYSFDEVQTLRSTLNDLIHQEQLLAQRGGKTPDLRVYAQLKGALDKDIEAFGEALPGDLAGKFKAATAYYRDYKGILTNETMRNLAKVAKENPEDVYRLLVRKGDVSDIKRAKKALGEGSFGPMRRRFVEDLVTGADGMPLRGNEITRRMASYGMETLREILSPEQVAQVQRFAKTREMPRFMRSEMEKSLSRAIDTSPEEVVKRVINGDTDTLKALKNIVSPEDFKEYKRRVLADIIGEPPPPDLLPELARTPSALRMDKTLKSYDDGFLKTLFEPGELAEISKIEDTKALMESSRRLQANASQTAPAALSWMATGSGVTLAFYNPIAGATLALGADTVSRLLASKAGRKLILDGLDPKNAGKAAIAAAITAQIGAATVRGINRQKEQDDEKARKAVEEARR